MVVVFLHGPVAAGKHTIGTRLSALTGLPLFHNHLAVDAALSLFPFGSEGFNALRAAIWRTAFAEAAAAGQSFIFTFHPEASVDPALVKELRNAVVTTGGEVFFVELTCPEDTVLARLGSDSRRQFRKLTDPDLYRQVQAAGGFAFPPLPRPLITIPTDQVEPEQAARAIAEALTLVL